MDRLFHIKWGDGDDCFVLAQNQMAARVSMGDNRDLITRVTELPALLEKIRAPLVVESEARRELILELTAELEGYKSMSRRLN